MIPPGSGLESPVYRGILIAGGLGILVLIIVSAVFFNFSDPAGIAILGSITAVLVTILIYWWVKLLQAPSGIVSGFTGTEPPGLDALKSWSTLYTAMTVQGGNPAAALEARRSGQRDVLEWYAWANVLALYPLVWVWLDVLEIYRIDAVLMVVVYLGLITAMLVRTYFLFNHSLQSGIAGYLQPLGLDYLEFPTNEMPPGAELVFEPGGTLIAGERFDRQVFISIQTSASMVWVNDHAATFQINSEAGKLDASPDAPAEIKAWIRRLRKAKRWQGIRLDSEVDGMRVLRSARSDRMWLYDLWLVESLFEELKRQAI